MRPSSIKDPRVAQALELLQDILSEDAPMHPFQPWENARYVAPPVPGRFSATDRLSWWFRPLSGSQDPWADFFEQPHDALLPSLTGETLQRLQRQPSLPIDSSPRALSEPGAVPGPRAALRILLAEPEDEIIEDDAQAVVTCLYDFIHAFGQRDIDKALQYVDENYHTFYNDQETDRLGLAYQLKSLLDSLTGWEFEISIAEIPRPILHPDAILIYAEIQIDAVKLVDSTRRTILERRIAVFRKQPDRSWLISALSQI